MKRSIIMAVLGLCATHSESATIITALPYTVTALGTYVLNANLTLPDPNGVAVLVDTAVKGPVVVDLRGFTLTGTSGGNSIGVAVGREAINPGGADYPVN